MIDRTPQLSPHPPAPRVRRSDVRAARKRLRGWTRTTPVFHTSVDAPSGRVPVTLKLECLQFGGTFKTRGCYNALLAAGDRTNGVVLASSGNAGIAAALAAAGMGTTCTVVVPESAPHTKVATMWSHGAEVLWHGTTYHDAYEYAAELAAERGALELHAYDLPSIVAGAGVIGLELAEQVRGRPSVLVAIGGGGLLGGVAAAIGRRQPVIGVEPEGIATLRTARAERRPAPVEVTSIAADSLGAARLGDIAFDVCTRYDLASVVVTDDAITEAREYLWREFRIVVELAGATAFAAIRSGAYIPEEGERPVIVLCGANTDLSVF